MRNSVALQASTRDVLDCKGELRAGGVERGGVRDDRTHEQLVSFGNEGEEVSVKRGGAVGEGLAFEIRPRSRVFSIGDLQGRGNRATGSPGRGVAAVDVATDAKTALGRAELENATGLGGSGEGCGLEQVVPREMRFFVVEHGMFSYGWVLMFGFSRSSGLGDGNDRFLAPIHVVRTDELNAVPVGESVTDVRGLVADDALRELELEGEVADDGRMAVDEGVCRVRTNFGKHVFNLHTGREAVDFVAVGSVLRRFDVDDTCDKARVGELEAKFHEHGNHLADTLLAGGVLDFVLVAAVEEQGLEHLAVGEAVRVVETHGAVLVVVDGNHRILLVGSRAARRDHVAVGESVLEEAIVVNGRFVVVAGTGDDLGNAVVGVLGIAAHFLCRVVGHRELAADFAEAGLAEVEGDSDSRQFLVIIDFFHHVDVGDFGIDVVEPVGGGFHRKTCDDGVALKERVDETLLFLGQIDVDVVKSVLHGITSCWLEFLGVQF